MLGPSRPLSFGIYLAGLVAAALIPVIVLAAAVITQDVALQQRELRAVLGGAARAVTRLLDERLAGDIAALTALSASPRMQNGEFALFVAEAQVLLAGHQRWQSVTLVSATGTPLAVARGSSASVPLLGSGVASAEHRLVPTGATVTAFPAAFPGHAATVEVGVPIERDGKVVGALWAHVASGGLRAALTSQRVLPRWTSMIIAADGVVLEATDARLVGQPFPYLSLQDIHTRRDVVTVTHTAEGTRAYVALDRLTMVPWTIAYVAPGTGALSAPLHSPLWAFLLALAVIVPLLAVGLAGSFLRRQVRGLAGVAAAVSGDDPMPPEQRTGVREIDAVHDALRHAQQALAERVANRERLHEAEVALLRSQRAEAISHLTSAIAHDFGNLALAISAQLELVRHELGDQPRVARLIEPALKLTGEAGRMMGELMTAVRTPAPPPRPTQLNELIRDTAALLRQAAGRGVRTEFSLQPDLWHCSINHTMLKSALFNLVINAKAAMSKGGILRIQTCNTTVPPDVTAADEPSAGDYVMLVVSDTGAGIAPDTLDRIFDPFFTTRTNDKGTGLGLAMVREFVIQSGGHVRVTSRVGVGSTFFLYFPRSDEESGSRECVACMSGPVNPDRMS